MQKLERTGDMVTGNMKIPSVYRNEIWYGRICNADSEKLQGDKKKTEGTDQSNQESIRKFREKENYKYLRVLDAKYFEKVLQKNVKAFWNQALQYLIKRINNKTASLVRYSEPFVTFRSLAKQTTTRNIYNNIYSFSRWTLVWSRRGIRIVRLWGLDSSM